MLDRVSLAQNLALVRSKSPIVHNITNYVAMNINANALLAIGASPIMAHAPQEMEAMVAIAGALVINIGTLDEQWIEGMMRAGAAMSKLGRPIVLDPVGAGATQYRTDTCHRIIKECRPTIIRGNGSEIMSLIDSSVLSKGVDSSVGSDMAVEAAKILARDSGAVVVVSGETDYVTDGERVETISNGSKMMTSVTAMGCTATAIIGAFAAIKPLDMSEQFEAALSAMAVMGVAGERAAKESEGSGSLHVNFIDELYNLDSDRLAQFVRA